MNAQPDARGYYGEFGGAFVPELLHQNVEELSAAWQLAAESPEFRKELDALLKDYVGRPTPLYFAAGLSARYQVRIYLKREDLCHTGAHKLNNVVGQALLARRMGKRHIVAETGAGQHGVATATVCAMLGIPCKVFMGEKDTRRQELNVLRMRMLGAEVVPVTSGSRTLKDATNEAIRYWINHPEETYYLIGSTIGPHPYPDMVARFQSVISEEIGRQLMDAEGVDRPDLVMACVGGGSNAAGAFYHFIGNGHTRLIGAEAAGEGLASGKTAATIALGKKGVLHGTMTLLMQTVDGQVKEAHSVSAGLDYPGIGPMHAYLHASGKATYLSVTDQEALQAALMLTRTEGIIPALESAHALALLDKVGLQPDDVVVINLSGRGDKDMGVFRDYFEASEESMQKMQP
jgi:tryptophan synthase beta chain